MKPWWKTYQTQVLEETTPWGVVRHLKITRRDGKEVRTKWDVLQHIKDEMLGEDVAVIEVFPAQSQVVNQANIRHFWEIPEGHALPFGLHLMGGCDG